MKEQSSNEQFKSHEIDFIDSLDRSEYSKTDLEFIERNISLFLEELKRTKKFLNLNSLNSEFINKYLSEILPKNFPEFSTNKVVKTQTIIKKFLNYLTLQDVIKKKESQTIFRNLYNISELKAVLNKKQEKVSDKKRVHKEQLLTIKNKILHFSLNYGEYIEEHREHEIFEYFGQQKESIIVSVILDLFKLMEDNEVFMKLFTFIVDLVKFNSLPSRVISILRKQTKHNSYFYRLILLYQTFFFSGYTLKKSYEELIEELEVDPETIKENFIKMGIIPSLDEVKKNEEILEDIKEFIDVKSLINKIKPFDKTIPFTNIDTGHLFKFPKDIKMDIKKHCSFLDDVYWSLDEKNKFIKSNYGDFTDYFSKVEEKKIMHKAQELYYDGQYKKALVLINKLIKKFPENAIPIYLRAKMREAQGQFYTAFRDVSRCIELDPFKIEAYMDLSYILEIGGYFYSSTIITCQLMRFSPFDFNYLLQLAINSYQLLGPYKNALKLAGQLNPMRLANFLSRYWVNERIKPRDSLKYIGMTRKQFNELRMQGEQYISKAIEVMDKNPDGLTKDNKERLNAIVRNPLHFFPNRSDHILRNWFTFELMQRLLLNFYQIYFTFTPLIATEDFVQLCFEIAKITTDAIFQTISMGKNRAQTEIDTELILTHKKIVNNPELHLLYFFISKQEVSNILIGTALTLFLECRECPNQCPIKPNKWCLAFYEFGKIEDDKLMGAYDVFLYIDCLISDLEYYLEEKGLKQKTISIKVQDAELFFTFLINEYEINDNNEVEDLITIDTISEFLSHYVLKNEIITTKTSMAEMSRSLKSLISVLYHEYGLFQDGTFSKLNKLLTKKELFIKYLEKERN